MNSSLYNHYRLLQFDDPKEGEVEELDGAVLARHAAWIRAGRPPLDWFRMLSVEEQDLLAHAGDAVYVQREQLGERARTRVHEQAQQPAATNGNNGGSRRRVKPAEVDAALDRGLAALDAE